MESQVSQYRFQENTHLAGGIFPILERKAWQKVIAALRWSEAGNIKGSMQSGT
jgi:hypothetical protein